MMSKQRFDESNFDDQVLACPDCGWTGKGAEAHIVDLYGVSRDMEVHCPHCDGFLGVVKRPEPPKGSVSDALSEQIG